MAVKVMLAPSLVKRDEPPERKPRGEGKPRRRRSSVYDASGNEVFITLMCLKCRKMRPLSQFGLRRMADGAIRNQPWCKPCRSGASGEDAKRRDAGAAEDGALAVQGAGPDEAVAEAAAEKPLDAGTLAAQVVAALHGGRR
jgi:hypothetical protein